MYLPTSGVTERLREPGELAVDLGGVWRVVPPQRAMAFTGRPLPSGKTASTMSKTCSASIEEGTHGDSCARGHARPRVERQLLLSKGEQHVGLEQPRDDRGRLSRVLVAGDTRVRRPRFLQAIVAALEDARVGRRERQRIRFPGCGRMRSRAKSHSRATRQLGATTLDAWPACRRTGSGVKGALCYYGDSSARSTPVIRRHEIHRDPSRRRPRAIHPPTSGLSRPSPACGVPGRPTGSARPHRPG